MTTWTHVKNDNSGEGCCHCEVCHRRQGHGPLERECSACCQRVTDFVSDDGMNVILCLYCVTAINAALSS